MIRLRVNGSELTFDGDPEMPLLWYLRDNAGLTGTKFGCGIAQCGACTVHPNGIEMQMQGSINDGLSVALGQKITVSSGRIYQQNFDRYQMMRMDMAPPEIEVHIVDSEASPSGMGEMGIPPLAPALCNAIFAATGKRIRSLPIGDQLTQA